MESKGLLSLRRMASRLGVSSKWLKERAEAGEIPALRAGARWLFCPDVVFQVVAKMAAGSTRGEEACPS